MIHFIKALNWYSGINIPLQLRRLTTVKQYYLTESRLGASKVIPMLNINSKIVLSKDLIRFLILNISQIEILVKSLLKLYKP